MFTGEYAPHQEFDIEPGRLFLVPAVFAGIEFVDIFPGFGILDGKVIDYGDFPAHLPQVAFSPLLRLFFIFHRSPAALEVVV